MSERYRGKSRAVRSSVIVTLALVWSCAGTAASAATVGFDANGTASGENGRLAIPVALSAAPGEDIAGLQFDLVFDSGALRYAGIETGDAASAAGKTAHSNLMRPGKLRVVVAGFNRNAIAGGTVVRVNFDGAAADGRAATVRMAGAVLSDPFGSPVHVMMAPETLILDGEEAIGIGTATANGPGARPAMASLAKYRALIFAAIAVGIAVVLSRSAPKKGRRR